MFFFFGNWTFLKVIFITTSQLQIWNCSLKAGVWEFTDKDGVNKCFTDEGLLKIYIFYMFDFDAGRFFLTGLHIKFLISKFILKSWNISFSLMKGR